MSADAATRIRLEPSWKSRLEDELRAPAMQSLSEFLRTEKALGKAVYPPGAAMFAAFDRTPFDRVKVVILGQDPYHGPGQAHGFSFSVPGGVPIPPSLANIFAEQKRDLGIEAPTHGCLTTWADRGVLLLNAVLSVEKGRAGAHQGRGWEAFTDRVIGLLSAEREGVVFMLWGSYAQAKAKLIDGSRHLILRAPHPSPLSAYRGFIGCSHFSRANEYLKKRGFGPVDWQLPRTSVG